MGIMSGWPLRKLGHIEAANRYCSSSLKSCDGRCLSCGAVSGKYLRAAGGALAAIGEHVLVSHRDAVKWRQIFLFCPKPVEFPRGRQGGFTVPPDEGIDRRFITLNTRKACINQLFSSDFTLLNDG